VERLGERLFLACAEALGKHACDLRIEVDLTGPRRANGPGDLVSAGVLQQVARCAGLQRGSDLVLLDERGDSDDVRFRVRLVDGTVWRSARRRWA
jgi:hypothetical protein